MHSPLGMARRAALAVVLAAGGVVAATGLSPTSHATTPPPTVSAQWDGTSVHITGSNFTPGGYVEVLAFDESMADSPATDLVISTTSGGCTRYVCFVGGTIADTLPYAPPNSTYLLVVAYDLGSGTWTSFVKAPKQLRATKTPTAAATLVAVGVAPAYGTPPPGTLRSDTRVVG